MKDILLALVVISLPLSTLFAQVEDTTQVNDFIVVIAEKSELRDGNDVVGTVERGDILLVLEVKDDPFLVVNCSVNTPWTVKYKATRGMINRADVIHIDGAIDFFTKSIRQNPQAYWDFYNRGYVWLHHYEECALEEYMDKALKDFNAVLRLNPQYVIANRDNVRAANLVVVIAGKAKLKVGDDVIGTLNRGDIRSFHDVKDDSFEVYLTEGNPWPGTEGWISRTDVIHLDFAIGFFTKAINQNPKAYWDFYNRGLVWRSSGYDDKAFEDFSEAIRINPQYLDAYKSRAEISWFSQRYDKAIKDYSKVIQLDAEDSYAYRDRANLYRKTGDDDKAIEDYSKLIQFDSEDSDVYLSRALSWMRKDNYDQAIKDYDEVIRLAPERSAAYSYRGGAYEKKGDYAKAISDYKVAIHTDGGAYSYNDLAWLFATCPDARYRNEKEAVRYAEKACERSGSQFAFTGRKRGAADPKYIVTLAAAYAANGDFVEAIKHLRQVMKEDPVKFPKSFLLDESVKTDLRESIKLHRKMLAAFEAGKPYVDKP